MKFYHATTPEHWKEIQQEGLLWGKRGISPYTGKEISRCTYLAVNETDAEYYGTVILEIEYEPFISKKENNYCDGCWQVRVYEPINISNIKLLKIMDYPRKSAKVKDYSENAIVETLNLVGQYIGPTNVKGEQSRILEVLKSILDEHGLHSKNASIFIRAFNQMIKEYNEYYDNLPVKVKPFYIHYWLKISKEKFMNRIMKIDDENLISHSICLARAFWRKQAKITCKHK